MSKFKINRRQFLGTSALAGLGASTTIGFSGAAGAGSSVKTLVYVFLRGGMDGLSLVVPTSGVDLGHYMGARDDTAIDPNGSNPPLNLDGLFGLHPFCGDLWAIRNKLAIVHAAGHPPGTHTRSHFDAQEQIELGTPGQQSAINGWLARYLADSPHVMPGAVFSALVSSSNPPVSLNGYSDVATLDSADSFHPNSGTYANTHLEMLQLMYSGNSDLDAAAGATLDAIDLVNSLDLDNYTPAGGVVYEDNSIADDLKLVAQLIREDLGVAVATMDVGGWDNHTNQQVLNANNGFGQRITRLTNAMAAFYNDLAADGRGNDVALVVQTEFGRQVKENANNGTDHGLGCPMLVLGGGVTGGLYGQFPGLAPAQRIGDSVEPTTDFRQVLATAAAGLMDHPNVNNIFNDPGFTYQNVGFA